MSLTFAIHVETWPLAEAFVISRGAKSAAVVVVVEVGDGLHTGRGECVPYPRYGESPASVRDAIEIALADLSPATTPSQARLRLADRQPPGAARNALDCALWDLEAKQRGTRVAVLAGACVDPVTPVVTAYTLSLASPEAMAEKARTVAHLPLLKLKLGGPGDAERMRAVRAARPDARLIADANEAWTDDLLAPLMEIAAETGCELIEQPLPAGRDAALASLSHLVPVCADESLHTTADLPALQDRYEAVNIKLDKTGGLTEALALSTRARDLGFEIMVGSMVSTSLAIAPALLLAGCARWVDLDGPLLLAQDRPHGVTIRNGIIEPPCATLWG